MSARPPEELILRHEAFLTRQPVDRPLLGLWLGGYYPSEQFPVGAAAWRESQVLRPDDVRMENFKTDYHNLYGAYRKVADDFFYVGSAYWGIPWLEAIIGCPIIVGETTCWAGPLQNHLEDIFSPDVNLDANPWFVCLARFTKQLLEFSDNRFPVCVPLLRGPGDAATAVRGAMALTMDYIDRPESVRRLLDRCAAVRLEVLRKLKNIIPAWHGTYAAGGYPSRVWSKRTVAYNQEDSAAMLNPGLFKEFLLPLERRMCQGAEINFIHLHSGCLYPLNLILEDGGYDVLEINIDHEGAGPPLRNLLPTFKRIQSAGRPLLLWGKIDAEGWNLLRSELSPAGLSIQPVVTRPEEIEIFLAD